VIDCTLPSIKKNGRNVGNDVLSVEGTTLKGTVSKML
jgi:hypothetical protein